MVAMEIYTIGHSNRSLEEFIELLKEFEIKIVVDVRSFPGSKKFPHFSRAHLENELPKNEIIYKWMGDTLGGFRKGGYQAHIMTNEFKEGIEQLKAMIKERTVIMCAEKFPWKCHRKYISLELHKQGIKCIHILEKGKTWITKDLLEFSED